MKITWCLNPTPPQFPNDLWKEGPGPRTTGRTDPVRLLIAAPRGPSWLNSEGCPKSTELKPILEPADVGGRLVLTRCSPCAVLAHPGTWLSPSRAGQALTPCKICSSTCAAGIHSQCQGNLGEEAPERRCRHNAVLLTEWERGSYGPAKTKLTWGSL